MISPYSWLRFKIKKRRELDRREFVTKQLTLPPTGSIYDYAFYPQNEIIRFPSSFPENIYCYFPDPGSYLPFTLIPPTAFKERMELVENYP